MITKGKSFMIKEMYEKGVSISNIAREWGIDWKTVRKYIRSSLCSRGHQAKRGRKKRISCKKDSLPAMILIVDTNRKQEGERP
ncbi:hypothetical protein EP10_000094 [Geobacillus icigianus]|uniref:Resolvase HTH domain-containing protein n=1 Tax=Geobacillus icigianus TaxID=1430331 RepID=A0ABU6BBG4_9BACL|nr:hypothetical protein [Geobacillus icigianus]